MKLNSVLVSLLIFLLLLAGIASAEDSVSFDVSASPVKLNLQDTLTVSITVRITGDDSNFDISEPQAPLLGNFELISSGSISKRFLSENNEPTVVRTTRHLYRPLAPGTTTIPSISLDYVDKRTGRVSTLRSSELSVDVIDTSGSSGKLVGLIFLAAIVAIVVATSIVIYRRIQKKRIRIAEAVDVDRSAEDELAQALGKANIQIAHGKRSEAQTTLTDAIFAYVKRRYSHEIRNRSSAEAADVLHKDGAPNILIDNAIKLTEWSEGLKFSGMSRSEAELKEVLSALQQIVELSPP